MADHSSLWCSVIVPVYEHWNLVPALLACFQAQTLEEDKFEVLLVDNGSTDFSPPKSMPANTRVLRWLEPGSYAARNGAVQEARGQWLVFTDADCLPRQDYLEQLVRKAKRCHSSRTLLAGAIRMRPSEMRRSAYEMYDLVKGIPQDWYVSRGYATTANLAVPTTLFRKLGGFDTSRYSGGDAAFCRKAVAEGAELVYVPEAIIEHPTRTTWRELATKARRIKGGQLTAGSTRQRAVWLLRTFSPPVVALWRFMRTKEQPVHYRLTSVAVQLRIWGVEVTEAVRLAFASPPERR
ncbi:MAG: glycosyltransferase [Ectothiorhodospiraceae bacterium]|nr:glycosyltransferase [Ectothiorhodospiraceae bacterium]